MTLYPQDGSNQKHPKIGWCEHFASQNFANNLTEEDYLKVTSHCYKHKYIFFWELNLHIVKMASTPKSIY